MWLNFLCAQCLCLHGKLLFLCVSGTNISSWIGEVLFMCWQCLMECRWRMSFSATNHAPTKVGAFFLLHFFSTRSLWMQMFTYICLYCLNGTAELPEVQLLAVSHILFPFFRSQSLGYSFYTFLLLLDLRILSKMTNIAFLGNQTQNLGVATA